MRHRISRRDGFTLVELMIVVVIIGILSVVAIPAFRSYLYRSKTTEATSFLGEIKQRQEAYRSEFGAYASCSPNPAATYPRVLAGGPADADTVAWGTPPLGSGWSALGVRPDGYVRFAYSSVAGPPGTNPGGSGFPGALGYTGTDFWFVSEARGNLDGDATQFFFESYSESSGIYCSSSRGWD